MQAGSDKLSNLHGGKINFSKISELSQMLIE